MNFGAVAFRFDVENVSGIGDAGAGNAGGGGGGADCAGISMDYDIASI